MLYQVAALIEAQAGPPVDIMRQLWEHALSGTPLIVLLLMAGLYYVNSERREMQKRYDALFTDYVELSHQTQDALRAIRDMFGSMSGSRRHGSEWDRDRGGGDRS